MLLTHILERNAQRFPERTALVMRMPFTAGACIVFVSTPAAIADLLAEHRITKMVAVPEFLKVMMSNIEERASASHFPLAALRRLSRHLSLKPLQRLLVFPFMRIFMKLKVEGLEHLDMLPLPAVFMPNHTSYLDSRVTNTSTSKTASTMRAGCWTGAGAWSFTRREG